MDFTKAAVVLMLHHALQVADRTATVHFLHDVLGMHALRHEEFKQGCKAACNGPYSGMWSKTMMGYDSEARQEGIGMEVTCMLQHFGGQECRGSYKIRTCWLPTDRTCFACNAKTLACISPPRRLLQDSAFVLELTYNYDVKGYRPGNDHVYFKIRNRVAYTNLEEQVRLARGYCTGAAPGLILERNGCGSCCVHALVCCSSWCIASLP